MPFGKIGGVSSNFIRDDPCFYIVLVRETKVFFRGYIAEHGAAKPTNQGGSNPRGYMVVARSNVCCERAKGVERGFMTELKLFLHVFFDELHRDMSRPFNHDLYIVLPSNFSKFA